MLIRERLSWTLATLTSRRVSSFCALAEAMADLLRLLSRPMFILRRIKQLVPLVLSGEDPRNSLLPVALLPHLPEPERTGLADSQMSTLLLSPRTRTKVGASHSAEDKRRLCRGLLALSKSHQCASSTLTRTARVLRAVDRPHRRRRRRRAINMRSLLRLRSPRARPRLIGESSILTGVVQPHRRRSLPRVMPMESTLPRMAWLHSGQPTVRVLMVALFTMLVCRLLSLRIPSTRPRRRHHHTTPSTPMPPRNLRLKMDLLQLRP